MNWCSEHMALLPFKECDFQMNGLRFKNYKTSPNIN